MNPHLRSEKNCLNCGAYVEERYCTRCGQENVEIKESFGHLISHFFSDLTHYDSKLFTTLKDLLFKPGFLTKEYLAGRRTAYLHPIRMYVFVSFLYFLITLGFNNVENQTEEAIAQTAAQNAKKKMADSLTTMLSTGEKNQKYVKIKDSILKSIISKINADSIQDPDFTIIFNLRYKDLVAFDSTQNLLPEQKKEKGFVPWLYHRWLNTIRLYSVRETKLQIANKTVHFVPKMMFVLLPLFALLLKLFYNKKKYFYADHLILCVHFHTAVFLLFLTVNIISLLFPALSKYTDIQFLLVSIYLGFALSKTYNQSVLVTIFKVVALTIIYSIFVLAGYVILALIALL
jgi:hypothetical protein